MYVPKINARATNIELTVKHRSLIINKLSSLGRLLDQSENARIDLAIRKIDRGFGSSLFCLSGKLTTRSGSYVAVAMEPYLAKALNRLNDALRRAITKGTIRFYDRRRTNRAMSHDVLKVLVQDGVE